MGKSSAHAGSKEMEFEFGEMHRSGINGGNDIGTNAGRSSGNMEVITW